jgi:signal transduction histidine kinase
MAIPIGVCGGVAAFVVSRMLGLKWIFRLGKIDDPAEAIAVHAGAGAAGILIAAAFSSHDLPVSLYTQILGLTAIGAFTFAVVAGVFFVLNGRPGHQAPITQTKYYAETFGPRVWKKELPVEEVLGKVHYLFSINYVRSTKHEEHIGLRFEPTSVRPAAFPLRTAFVAQELQQDVQEFFSALVSAPVHNLGSTIKRMLRPEDFRSEERYALVTEALLGEIERMKDLGVLTISREPVLLRQIVIKIRKEFAKEVHGPVAPNFFCPITDYSEAEQSEEFKVQAQSEILENIVRALFSNAVLAVFGRADCEKERYEPMIRWELRRDAQRVVLSVIDNGGGVSRAVEDRLFEPFNVGRTAGGHGLGLFYGAKMAEAFGGRLVLAQNGRDGQSETQFDLILRPFEEAKL